MAFEHEQQQAMRMLDAVEQGTMSASNAYTLLRDADPTLVYFIFTWIRAHYPPTHPAAEGVLGRVVAICSTYPAITSQVKRGQADAVVRWFEENYTYKSLRAHEFIELIVEKLEG
jgi:hypothetical protein